MNNSSSFTVAGFDVFASIMDLFFKGDEYKDNFTRQQVNNFLSKNCSRFLLSYGQNFKNRKSYAKYNSKVSKTLLKCRNTQFFNGLEFIVDSGGFQISVGMLDEREKDILSNLYYSFLCDYHESYDSAFILDVVPGCGCKIFKSGKFDEVFDLNMQSYNIAKELPKHVRDKIIYIHHFRTPGLWRTFERILDEGEMFDKFNYHATGGIVANMSSDIIIPCIIYVLPLIPLINRAIKCGRKFLNFHVLGGANFRDILFYELFKLHVKNKFDIELTITYDSSGIFKALMMGRYMFVINNKPFFVSKLDLRSNNLNNRFYNDKRVIDVYKDSIQEMVDLYNFKNIDLYNLYNNKTNTFYYDIRLYSMFYVLYMYKKMEDIFKKLSVSLYDLYLNECKDEFNIQMELLTKGINSGKITKKQKAKCNSVWRSLDMLTNLDENYCLHLVDKYLQKDEFEFLTERRLLCA